MTAALVAPGWIGSWSPGIGDPTPMGWITVVGYLAAAWLCFRVGGRLEVRTAYPERHLWRILTWGLLVLGVSKQLDLQSALTELGRTLAHAQGW